MKTLLSILLAVLSPWAYTMAQAVRLGIKAGGSITTLVGPGTSIEPKISPLFGFAGGVYRTIPIGINGAFTLQPELLYSQQGYRLSNASTNYEATLRLHYVCLPVLLTFTEKHWFARVGPQASYLAGVRERYAFQSPIVVGQTVRINTDPSGHSRWDAALVAGLGYRWPMGFGLELRYIGSLNSIYPDRNNQPSAKPRNAGLQLQASLPLLVR